MKDVLKRLLQAEEAGRHEAAELEAAGEQLLREAQAESEQIARHVREEAAARIDQLTTQADEEIASREQTVQQEVAATMEQLKQRAARRHRDAVDRAIEMLLGSAATTSPHDTNSSHDTQ